MIAALPNDSRQKRCDWDNESIAETAMRVSRFDVVSSLFAALLWFLGIAVAVLFLLWCLAQATTSPQPTPRPAVTFLGAAANGGEPDFETPDGPEIEQLTEPDLTEVVAQIELASTQLAGQPLAGNNGTPGSGSEQGPDQRSPGDPDGEDIVPRWERWQLVFNTTNLKDYSTQLDGFGIELGAFGGGVPGIDYANQLSAQPTQRHQAKPSQEKRLYFSWQNETELIRFEQTLLRQADVALAGRHIVKFIPRDLEDRLADAEMRHAQKAGIESVRGIAKTVFESRSTQTGYEFVVLKQRYRKSNSTNQ